MKTLVVCIPILSYLPDPHPVDTPIDMSIPATLPRIFKSAGFGSKSIPKLVDMVYFILPWFSVGFYHQILPWFLCIHCIPGNDQILVVGNDQILVVFFGSPSLHWSPGSQSDVIAVGSHDGILGLWSKWGCPSTRGDGMGHDGALSPRSGRWIEARQRECQEWTHFNRLITHTHL